MSRPSYVDSSDGGSAAKRVARSAHADVQASQTGRKTTRTCWTVFSFCCIKILQVDSSCHVTRRMEALAQGQQVALSIEWMNQISHD